MVKKKFVNPQQSEEEKIRTDESNGKQKKKFSIFHSAVIERPNQFQLDSMIKQKSPSGNGSDAGKEEKDLNIQDQTENQESIITKQIFSL